MQRARHKICRKNIRDITREDVILSRKGCIRGSISYLMDRSSQKKKIRIRGFQLSFRSRIEILHLN